MTQANENRRYNPLQQRVRVKQIRHPIPTSVPERVTGIRDIVAFRACALNAYTYSFDPHEQGILIIFIQVFNLYKISVTYHIPSKMGTN